MTISRVSIALVILLLLESLWLSLFKLEFIYWFCGNRFLLPKCRRICFPSRNSSLLSNATTSPCVHLKSIQE
jgi:hypothetical protein